MKRSVVCCLMTLLLATTSARASDAQEREVTTPARPPSAKPDAPSDLEALAVETLREHLANPAADVALLSITPTEWRDSSMGCPRPDFSYMQVITPGHLAVLRHGDTTYQVHMAEKRAFVCERAAGQVAKEMIPKLEVPITVERMEALARADLARRLGVSADQISVESAKPVVWQDLSLGCPEPGQTYKAVPVTGNVLSLLYHGRTYTYHTDRYRVLPCPPFQKD
ncbi:MAG TPA: hypothetical protein VJ764_03860 [Steroidobacteraceae bacterium]|nr:hypothetical protein [Steroidobacteraceae bacterium]